MTTQYAITASSWTPITSAGDSVSCWLDEDSDGAGGRVDVRLAHSQEGIPTESPSSCKRVYRPNGNADIIHIEADNSRDVWYARCLSLGDTALLSVDPGLNHMHEIDVNIQSQVNKGIQFYMMSEDKVNISFVSPVARDAVSFTLSDGHGFTTGTAGYEDYIAIWEGGAFDQAKVISVAGDVIGIRIPLSRSYTTSAIITRGKINMAVDGSSVQKKFYFRPRASTIPIDISMEKILLLHSAQGDDGKFGGISALTNGVLYRRMDGSVDPLGNYDTNQEFREHGWALDYPAKAPSGSYATECTMERINVHTHELRLDPRTNEHLEVTIRDNIIAGSVISKMVVSILGSFTSGE